MKLDIDSLIPSILKMLPGKISDWIITQLANFNTSVGELLSWKHTPPTPERQKELIKTLVYKTANKPLCDTLKYLTEQHGADTCIIIRNTPNQNNELRPTVYIATGVESPSLALHDSFLFYKSGDVIIDTLQREKHEKIIEELKRVQEAQASTQEQAQLPQTQEEDEAQDHWEEHWELPDPDEITKAKAE